MRLRSIVIDGGFVGAGGAWLWLIPTFDQTVHVVGSLLVLGILVLRAAIAWREYRRARRWR